MRLGELDAAGRALEAQRLASRTRYDLEMIREVGYCAGIENYSRYFDGRRPGERPACLLDYFPRDYLLVIDESHVTLPQLRAMYKGDRSRKETLVEHGFRLPSALDNRPLRFAELEALVPQTIFVSATPGDWELEQSGGVIVEQVIRPTGLVDPEIIVAPAVTQIDDLIGRVRVVVARGERTLVTTLTKKMAEDLTEYLQRLGIRVSYLHSDIVALDRVEILRALRLGESDVLVGVNLLREGLDLPEVSLVAILDADREGFLRSGRSLIQTAGRAARNSNGQVLMYADKLTDSMRYAIAETERRRSRQLAYNAEHHLSPQTILKTRAEIMQATSVAGDRGRGTRRRAGRLAVETAGGGGTVAGRDDRGVERGDGGRVAAARVRAGGHAARPDRRIARTVGSARRPSREGGPPMNPRPVPGFPDSAWLRTLVRQALAEDVGGGDVTTALAVATGRRAPRARIVARRAGVVAGLALAGTGVGRAVAAVTVTTRVDDGAAVTPGTVVAEIAGPAAAILTGERTALNFLQHLSGIATLTARSWRRWPAPTAWCSTPARPSPATAPWPSTRCGPGAGRTTVSACTTAFCSRTTTGSRPTADMATLVARARRELPELAIEIEVDDAGAAAVACCRSASTGSCSTISSRRGWPRRSRCATRRPGPAQPPGGVGERDPGVGRRVRRGRRRRDFHRPPDALRAGPRSRRSISRPPEAARETAAATGLVRSGRLRAGAGSRPAGGAFLPARKCRLHERFPAGSGRGGASAGSAPGTAGAGRRRDSSVSTPPAAPAAGAVAVARRQTRGRGRMGRTWVSAEGLLLSWLVPSAPTRSAASLAVWAGLVTAIVLREEFGLAVDLKWPNDLLIGPRKLGGLLLDAARTPTGPRLVAGLGLNLAVAAADLPADLRGRATSFRIEKVRVPQPAIVAGAILARFDAELPSFRADGWPPYLRRFAACDRLRGRRITLATGQGPVTGRAAGIDETGALLLRRVGRQRGASARGRCARGRRGGASGRGEDAWLACS